MMLMKKYIIYGCLAIVLGGLIGYSLYLYNSNKTNPVNVPVLQAQYKASQTQLKLHDAAYTVALDNRDKQIETLNSQRLNLCLQLKNLRQTSPNCTQ